VITKSPATAAPSSRTLPTAELGAILVVSIWGINFVFLKLALAQFDVVVFNLLRFGAMVVLGWLVLLWQKRRAGFSIRVKRADLPRLAFSGLVGFTFYITLSMVGVNLSTGFSAALLITTAPLWAALLLWTLKLEKISRRRAVGLAIAFAGVAVFVGEAGGRVGFGDLVNLGAAFCYAAYNVINKPLNGRYPPTVLTAWTLTIGAIPVVVLSLPWLGHQDFARVTAGGWEILAWSVVAPVYLAWTIWSWVSGKLGVSRTTAFMFLVPVVGGITAIALTGERFGTVKLLGAGLVLAGGQSAVECTCFGHLGWGVRTPNAPLSPRCLAAAGPGHVARVESGAGIAAGVDDDDAAGSLQAGAEFFDDASGCLHRRNTRRHETRRRIGGDEADEIFAGAGAAGRAGAVGGVEASAGNRAVAHAPGSLARITAGRAGGGQVPVVVERNGADRVRSLPALELLAAPLDGKDRRVRPFDPLLIGEAHRSLGDEQNMAPVVEDRTGEVDGMADALNGGHGAGLQARTLHDPRVVFDHSVGVEGRPYPRIE